MSDESFPNYKLRDLRCVDYRERSEDSSFEDSFEEDATLLAGNVVNANQQSNSSLNDICSVVPSSASLPSCSTPVGRERLPTVDGEFGPFVSPVESLLGCEQTSVDEEPIETIQRFFLEISSSVEETIIANPLPACSSTVSPVESQIAAALCNVISVQTYINDSVNSSASTIEPSDSPTVEVGSVGGDESGSVFLEPEGSQIEHSIDAQVETTDHRSFVYCDTTAHTVVTGLNPLSEVVEELSDNDIDMASQLRRLVADLETIMFQIDEIHDGMDTIHQLSYNTKSQTLNELKDLRIAMIKTKKELDLSRENEQYDYSERCDKLVVLAKGDIDSLKSALSFVDNSHEKAQFEQEARSRNEMELKKAERLSKANAFQRSVEEVHNMYTSLVKAYSLVDVDTSRDAMLKRDKEKQAIASTFNKK